MKESQSKNEIQSTIQSIIQILSNLSNQFQNESKLCSINQIESEEEKLQSSIQLNLSLAIQSLVQIQKYSHTSNHTESNQNYHSYIASSSYIIPPSADEVQFSSEYQIEFSPDIDPNQKLNSSNSLINLFLNLINQLQQIRPLSQIPISPNDHTPRPISTNWVDIILSNLIKIIKKLKLIRQKIKLLPLQHPSSQISSNYPEINQLIQSETCWSNVFQIGLNPENQSKLEKSAQEDLVDLLTDELINSQQLSFNLQSPNLIKIPSSDQNQEELEVNPSSTSFKLNSSLPKLLFDLYQDEQVGLNLNSPFLVRRILFNWSKIQPNQFFNFLNQIIFNPKKNKSINPDHEIQIDQFITTPIHESNSSKKEEVSNNNQVSTDEFIHHDSIEEAENVNEEFDSLSLLIDFITHLPYSIHKIQNSNLLSNLIKSIILHPVYGTGHLESNSKQIIRFKLTIDAILIILPRLSSFIGSYLPFLLIALARSIDILNLYSFETHTSVSSSHSSPSKSQFELINLHQSDHSIQQEEPNFESILNENKVDQKHTQDGQSDQVKLHLDLNSSVFNLFNFLYGIAPCNLIDFLRSPIDFIHSFNLGNINPESNCNNNDNNQSTNLDATSPTVLNRSPDPINTPNAPNLTVLRVELEDGYKELEKSVLAKIDELIHADRLRSMIGPLMGRHKLNKGLILMKNSMTERREISNRLRFYEAADLIEMCESNLIFPDNISHVQKQESLGIVKSRNLALEEEEENPAGKTIGTTDGSKNHQTVDKIHRPSINCNSAPGDVKPSFGLDQLEDDGPNSKNNLNASLESQAEGNILKEEKRDIRHHDEPTAPEQNSNDILVANANSIENHESDKFNEANTENTTFNDRKMEEDAEESQLNFTELKDRTQHEKQISELKIQINLLKNQLNLELYLKSQHLQQLGSIHKQNIIGAGLEAENQNLLRINKELKKKLKNLNECKISNNLKSMKNMKNNFDYLTIIKNKNLSLKDENFKILNEKFNLLNDLNELEKVFKLKSLNFDLLQIEAHNLKNELKLMQPKLLTIEELEKNNRILSQALLTWDDDLRRFRESRKQIDILRGQWKKFELLSISATQENDKLRVELQNQIGSNSKLELENKYLKERVRRLKSNRFSRSRDLYQGSESGSESMGKSASDSKQNMEGTKEGLNESSKQNDCAIVNPENTMNASEESIEEECIGRAEENTKHTSNLRSINSTPPSIKQPITKNKKPTNLLDQVAKLENQITAYRQLNHQLKLELIQRCCFSS